MMAASAVRYFSDLNNFFWIAKVGTHELAVASGLSYFLWVPQSLVILTSVGTSSFVARARGAKHLRTAGRLSLVATEAAFLLGLVTAIASFVAKDLIFSACRIPPELHDKADSYFLIQIASLPLIFAQVNLSSALVGLDDPNGSLLTNGISMGIAAILTPIFVFPLKMGLAGAAWAFTVGYASGVLYGYLRGRKVAIKGVWNLKTLARIGNRRTLRELLPVLRVGSPLMADSLFHGIVAFIMVALIARYGEAYVSGLATGDKLTFILNLPAEGLSRAAVVLVGFYLGRQDQRAAKRAVLKSVFAASALGLIGTFLLLLSPRGLVSLFSEDEQYLKTTIMLLRISAVSLAFLGVREVMDACFGGIGYTLPPLLSGFLATALRLPIVYALMNLTQLRGAAVAWAFTITIPLNALVLTVWFFLRFDSFADKYRGDTGEEEANA